jgi:hypothetical protein
MLLKNRLESFGFIQKANNIKKLIELVEKRLMKNKIIRFSETKFNLTDLNNSEKEDYLAILINFIQEESKQYFFDTETIENLYLCLTIGRNIAEQTNRLECFYMSLGILLDGINNSDFSQQARDFAEEFLLSSFNYNLTEYGFYLSYKVYSHQSSALLSLLYANLMLLELNFSKKSISNKLLKDFIIQSIRFFRNVWLLSIVDILYFEIPNSLDFDDYEKRSLEYSYLLSKLYRKDPKFPFEYAYFLSKNREDVLTAGEIECMPLLLTIYNSKIHYSETIFKDSTLDQYLTLLEKVVPESKIADQKLKIFGDSPQLKILYKETLNKLSSTRHKTDFINDVQHSIIIANKLILFSSKVYDYEAFLLAMIVKSDFSTIFSNKDSDLLIPASYLENKENDFSKYIVDPEKAIQDLEISVSDSIFLFAISDNRTFQMIYNGDFKLNELNNFRSDISNNWLENKNDLLTFDSTIHDGNVRNKVQEDFEEETNSVIKSLNFAKVKSVSYGNLLIIKDMDISGFPHNLFLTDKNQFIFLCRPTINIMSLEWFSKIKETNSKLNINYTKSIWIPVEREDFAISLLFSKLEDTLKLNEFNIQKDLNMVESFSSDINIISAHGNSDISNFHTFFTNESESIQDVNKVIGKGKILILFICHSGSMEKSKSGNKISSFAKHCLESGYQTVIAPFWSLSIDLPPIWLPIFLNELDSGETVLSSFHKASLAIKEKYPTPSAWACLHIYGNPYLRIS